MEKTTGADDPRQHVQKRGLQDASLVVPLFVPGVGKEKVDALQAGAASI